MYQRQEYVTIRRYETVESEWKVCVIPIFLKCSDGTYYTGWTNDLDKRLKAHNGGKSGAKYTRNRRPVTLVYYEEFQGKQEAMKREYAIKQLTRKEKENLIKEKNMQQKGSQDTKRGSEQNQNL